MSTSMVTDFGPFELERWPTGQSNTLQAWDAADEYLLSHVYETMAKWSARTSEKIRILLVNDAFGALSCALHAHDPVNWSDSLISHQAARENWQRNGIEAELSCVTSMDVPEGPFDLVLIKVPKTIALLEFQLSRLRPILHETSQVVAAGMLKHLPRSAFEALEQYVGSITTSLARKKARLIFSYPDVSTVGKTSPYPTVYTDSATGLTLCNHANVFSRERLDSGARYLLSQFDQLPASEQAIDLGCGNGVLGIALQQRQPQCAVRYIDESYMAVASARQSHARMFSESVSVPVAQFEAGCALVDVDDQSSDLILCNPPFHQEHVIGAQVAMALFEASKRVLKQHGELWIVANRHLGYHKGLNALFGNCRTVDSNTKFVVYRVIKR